MLDFQKNKWKYSTLGLFGLLAILVIPSAILPQANAVADNTQLVQQIRNIVLDIQTKVNTLATGATANTSSILAAITSAKNSILSAISGVQSDTDDIQTQIGDLKAKSVDTSISLNPDQGSSKTKDIIVESSGKTFSGVITGVVEPNGNKVQLWCEIGQRFTFLGGQLGGDDPVEFSFPFACKNLAVVVSDEDDVGAAKISTTTQYFTSTQVTTQ